MFLHFQEDAPLRQTVILQNRWATEAVFRILDDEAVKARKGRFMFEDCARAWASAEYAQRHSEVLALMERFELCYELRDSQPATWLVPQLLAPSAPVGTTIPFGPGDLALLYRYAFLPRGLVSRLMVRLHRFVSRPELAWQNGALFERDHSQLLVRAEDTGNDITLRARGPESHGLLSVVASELDALNASFRGLEDKIGKWVPCVCEKCRSSGEPELFEQKRLMQRKRDGRLRIECPKSYADVSVLELLDGIRFEQRPSGAEGPGGERAQDIARSTLVRSPQPLRIVEIFLASSKELSVDRDAFELYFRQQNDLYGPRGVYLKIIRWENFLNAMSETRLQDEYNRKVRGADLFVSLFSSQAGKYTQEEFDVAHHAFQETGKPRIFTFFKKTHLDACAASLAGLQTLVEFQDRLRSLGHFHTDYENIEHLKLLFRDQLDQLGIGAALAC